MNPLVILFCLLFIPRIAFLFSADAFREFGKPIFSLNKVSNFFPTTISFDLNTSNLQEKRDSTSSQRALDSSLSRARKSWKNNDYKNAINQAKTAQMIAVKLKEDIKQADALRILGLIYSEIGLFEKSSEYYFQGLQLYEKSKNKKGIILSLNNIANSFADLQNKKKAIEFYNKSLKIAEASGDSLSMSMVLHNLGFLHIENNEYEQAEKDLRESIKLNVALNRELQTGMNYMALGDICAFQKNDSETERLYKKAYDIFEKEDSKIHLARINLTYSNYYLEKDDYQRSLDYAKKSYGIGENLNLETIKIPASEQLYKIYKDQKDTIQANKYGLLYYQIKDSLERNQDYSKILLLEQAYDFERREQEDKIVQQKREFQLYIVIGVGVVIVLLTIVFFHNRHKIKQKDNELEKQKLSAELELKKKELTLNVMSFMRSKVVEEEVIERLLEIHKSLVISEAKSALKKIVIEMKRSHKKNIWKEFEVRFKDVHLSFHESLSAKFPNLTPNELKLAAFIRLNLSTKDISELTGKRVSTIEVARSRLRKKLGINNSQINLVSFLTKIG